MTTQYAVLPARSGRSYTAKLFTVADPDTEVTGNTITVTERTNAKGMFRAGIARASALPAGDYILVYLYGTLGAAVGYFTFAGTDGETATETAVLAELDSASRLAIWNTLTTETFTADSFGDLLLISDGTNGRAVKVTGAHHIAADVHDCQTDGLSGSTEITNIQNASGYLLAVLAGACADPQTASETYAITVFGSTFTVDMAGQTSTGIRTAPTLTKA